MIRFKNIKKVLAIGVQSVYSDLTRLWVSGTNEYELLLAHV